MDTEIGFLKMKPKAKPRKKDVKTVVRFDFNTEQWEIDLAVLRRMIRQGLRDRGVSFCGTFLKQAYKIAFAEVKESK
jgi:hypothetical protein